MRQYGILLFVAGCLALSSGCLCRGICTKRENELCCPTDIRRTHFWCFGEDAIMYCPCGPKEELYGYEPTSWREWPAETADSCGVNGSGQSGALPMIETPAQVPAAPAKPEANNPFRNGSQVRRPLTTNTMTASEESITLLQHRSQIALISNEQLSSTAAGYAEQQIEPTIEESPRKNDSRTSDEYGQGPRNSPELEVKPVPYQEPANQQNPATSIEETPTAPITQDTVSGAQKPTASRPRQQVVAQQAQSETDSLPASHLMHVMAPTRTKIDRPTWFSARQDHFLTRAITH